MPVLSSSPSSVVSAGAWLTTTNVYTSDNTYATNTGATQNTEYPMEVGGFDFSAIPADSTIDSITANIEIKTGNAARAQFRADVLDGSTVLGSRALGSMTTADANYTVSATATLAQVQSAALKVSVVNKRTASQANTTSLDYVRIDVVYTPPTFTADASVAGAGSVDATGQERFPIVAGASAAGAGSVGAAGGELISGTASAGGAGTAGAAGQIRTTASATGAGTTSASVRALLTASGTGVGSVTASGQPIILFTGRPKYWNGSTHIQKPGKWWSGTAWVEKPWKTWTGSDWKTAK